jgi:hypothetical protein
MYFRLIQPIVLVAIFLLSHVASGQWLMEQNPQLPPGVGVQDLAVMPNSERNVWVTGYDLGNPQGPCNAFSYTDDGGVTWLPGTVAPGLGLRFANITTSGSTGVAIVSMNDPVRGGGFLFSTADAGRTWRRHDDSLFAAPARVLGVVISDFYTLAMGEAPGEPFRSRISYNGGTSWQAAVLPAALPGEHLSPGTLTYKGGLTYFASTRGRVFSAAGTAWQAAATGLPRVDVLTAWGYYVLAMDRSQPQNLRISSDGGRTWHAVAATGPVFTTNLGVFSEYSGAHTFISTSSEPGNLGSSVSLDYGQTWQLMDQGTAHSVVQGVFSGFGWSGSANAVGQARVWKGRRPTMPADYCITGLSSVSSACLLNNVSMAGTTLNSNASQCSPVAGVPPRSPYYSLLPATGNTTASVRRGVRYQIRATSASMYQPFVGAWVDWNQNKTFEASEFVDFGVRSGAIGRDTVSIRVPLGAALGPTRLRLRANHYPLRADDVCYSIGGETRDYTLTVTPAAPAPPLSASPYCSAGQPATCSAQRITRVQLTGTTLRNTTTCTPGTAYTLFPRADSTTANLLSGYFHRLVVRTDSAANVSAWIDWNRDNVFSTTEWVQLRTVPGRNDSATVVVFAPVTLPPGYVRLRVRSTRVSEALGAGNACTSLRSGETEDYFLWVERSDTPQGYYCQPAVSGPCNYGLGRIRISGTTLDHVTTCVISPSGTPYNNYPPTGNRTATVERNGQYQLLLRMNSVEVSGGVWVDWNHNYVFETTESYMFYVFNGASSITIPLRVPSYAALGQTRMRIMIKNGLNNALTAAQACYIGSDAADYTITIVEAGQSGFCLPPPTGSCAANYLSAVQLGGTALSVSSTCQLDPTARPYTLHPVSGSNTATVLRGQGYPLRVTTAAAATVGAWADWNQNGLFESEEWQPITTRSTANTPAQVLLQVPPDAPTGAVRLRVRSYDPLTTPNAADVCGAMTGGETEDFTLTVADCPPRAPHLLLPSTLCAGDTLHLAAFIPTGPWTYRWTGPQGQLVATTASAALPATAVSQSGQYKLTVVGPGGCAVADSATVVVSAVPAASITAAGATVLCTGQSVTLTASPGLAYNWSTGAITQSITVSRAGRYWVRIANPGGCSSYPPPVTVRTATATAAPTLSASGPTTFCAGASVTLTIPTPAAGSTVQYLRNGTALAGATAVTYTVTQSGSYSVQLTPPGGCTVSSAPVVVTVNPATSAAFTYPALSRCQNTPALSPTITGSANGTFLVSPSNGLAMSATTGLIAPYQSQPGTYIITYTVSGTCPSSATATFTVLPNPVPTLTPSGATVRCAGDSLVLTAGGGGTYQFLLNNQPIPGATASTYTARQSGAYAVMLTTAAGCSTTSATSTFTLNPVPSRPVVAASYNGPTTTLTSSASAGNQWYLNGQLLPGATSPTYTVSTPAQLGAYTVVVTSPTTCASPPSLPLLVTASAPLLATGPTLQLAPNPTESGRVLVTLSGYRHAINLMLFNVVGQQLQTITLPAGQTQQELNLVSLPSGIYLLRATTNTGTTTHQIIRR